MHLMKRPEAWNPFREIEDLSNRLNTFFGFTKGNGERETLATTDWSPSCDITETDAEYRVHAELPGVTREDVHVTLDDGVLTIQGERREEKEEKGEKTHRRELSYGTFLRRFTMPSDSNESQVDATFKDGILNVVIGKSKSKSSKAQEIKIRG